MAAIEHDFSGAADASRDVAKQIIGEVPLHAHDLLSAQMREQGPHAARDVESDPASGDYAARLRIERCNTADRKPIAPVGVRHDIGSADNSREARDIDDLLQYLVVHLRNEPRIPENHRGHPHAGLRGQLPSRFR